MSTLDLDAIEADRSIAVMTIPDGDVTTEPGATILAARLRLQHEHVPALLATLRAERSMALTGVVDLAYGRAPWVRLSQCGVTFVQGYVTPGPSPEKEHL